MKIILFALIFSINTFAQTLQWINPFPQGNRLEKVLFTDSLHGWIYARANTIHRTQDGGNIWKEVITKEWISNIRFLDSLIGFAVGAGDPGYILKSTDGGKTWNELNIPEERKSGYTTFTDVFFIGQSIGFITNTVGQIFKTTDSGMTWEKKYQFLQRNEISSISFSDSLHGWAVGVHPLLYTTDAGNIWSLDSSILGGWKVQFKTQDHGWILQSDKIFKTTDRGKTWTSHPIPMLGEGFNNTICFIDTNNGWIASKNGLSYSSDGGIHWTRIDSTFSYRGVHFVSINSGWAVGGKLDNKIFKTEDGGKSWSTNYRTITDRGFFSVHFPNKTTGWIVGDTGIIINTTDEGVNWTIQPILLKLRLNSVHFVNKDVGWIAGRKGKILHTSDGGNMWEEQQSRTSLELRCIFFIDSLTGWAAGGDLVNSQSVGIILHTTNGGRNWTDVTPQDAKRFMSLYFTNAKKGWVVTGGGTTADEGKLYATTDEGKSWTVLIEIQDFFKDIYFSNKLHGWALSVCALHVTNDGGSTWRKLIEPTDCYFSSCIRFADSLIGYRIESALGKLHYTSDGGKTWIAEPERMSMGFRSHALTDKTAGWIVGDFGTILKFEKEIVTNVEIPHYLKSTNAPFEISEVYPNPFNNTITIGISLHQPQNNITLNLHDITGKIIYSLSDNNFRVGYNTITHIISNGNRKLLPGIYFLVVSSEQNKQTRKILFIH